MRLRYAEEDEAFRAELVTWLEAHVPSPAVLAQPPLSRAPPPTET